VVVKGVVDVDIVDVDGAVVGTDVGVDVVHATVDAAKQFQW